MGKTRRRKSRTHVPEVADTTQKLDPKTFVFRRGKHAAVLGDLEADIRRMMMPNTAVNLKESKRNVLKDFVAVAGPLGVSHFLILSASENASYLKVAKSPRGPTLTLRIASYSLVRDVASSQARPRIPQNAFKTPPLLVMNNFSGQEHLRLTSTLFQAMFPSINVHTVKLSACQRIVLVSYDKETDLLSLRHYSISVAPSGLRKSLKALVQRKTLPDLGNMQDVSEFVTKSGYGSESEGEDAELSRVTLPQQLGNGNVVPKQSRVRLHEIGPRLELEVVKVEEGLCDGAVLYHAHVHKSEQEASAQQRQVDEQAKLKAQRRRQQEENVRKKELLKQQKLEQQKQKKGAASQHQPSIPSHYAVNEKTADDDDDNDEEYFREEVGHEPDEEEKIGFKSTSWGRGGGRGGRGRGRGRGRGNFRGGGRGGGRGQPVGVIRQRPNSSSSNGFRGGRGGSSSSGGKRSFNSSRGGGGHSSKRQRRGLSTLSPDAPGQLNVLWHNGHTAG
eukprot:jgi/Chrzof1/6614/Cz19g02210.t1